MQYQNWTKQSHNQFFLWKPKRTSCPSCAWLDVVSQNIFLPFIPKRTPCPSCAHISDLIGRCLSLELHSPLNYRTGSMWIFHFYIKLQNLKDLNWIANLIFIKTFAFEEGVKCQGLPHSWSIFGADWARLSFWKGQHNLVLIRATQSNFEKGNII